MVEYIVVSPLKPGASINKLQLHIWFDYVRIYWINRSFRLWLGCLSLEPMLSRDMLTVKTRISHAKSYKKIHFIWTFSSNDSNQACTKNDYRITVIKMLRIETKRKYKGGRQQIRIQKAPIHMRLGIRHTTKD